MTRDQWLRQCAQRFIDRAGIDNGEAAAYAKECATLEVQDHGQDSSKWQPPKDAADDEIACWEDQD